MAAVDAVQVQRQVDVRVHQQRAQLWDDAHQGGQHAVRQAEHPHKRAAAQAVQQQRAVGGAAQH